jgi:hypothetical protein
MTDKVDEFAVDVSRQSDYDKMMIGVLWKVFGKSSWL